MTPDKAHQQAVAQGWLVLWTVYEKPTDYPNDFIARMHVVTSSGTSGPTTAHVKAKTLEQIRTKLPPGLTRLNRSPGDEPQIVETWI